MNASLIDLAGRTAIVTGGGRGIGKSICLALARAGADIVVAELNAPTAKSTAEEVQALGRKCLALPTDVTRRAQVEKMVQKAVDAFGTVDILVNNAGNGKPEQMSGGLDMTEETWDAIVDLNLKSVFLCVQAASKVMIPKKRGCIVNLASIAGTGPYPASIHYAAAKAGVINMTQTLSVILGPHGIRVNAVAPGFIVTELANDWLYKPHPELAEKRKKAIPRARLGTPEDIASLVAFLASDAADYIDGQVIKVDGGLPAAAGLTL